MTGVGGRPEVVIEGSNHRDAGWKEYEFLYKPGSVKRKLPVLGTWVDRFQPFLHTRVGDSRCVSKWYTTYVGDRFSEVMSQ